MYHYTYYDTISIDRYMVCLDSIMIYLNMYRTPRLGRYVAFWANHIV